VGEPSKAPSVGSLARGWGFLFEITRRAASGAAVHITSALG